MKYADLKTACLDPVNFIGQIGRIGKNALSVWWQAANPLTLNSHSLFTGSPAVPGVSNPQLRYPRAP